MDIRTLIVMNTLFFCLYAGLMGFQQIALREERRSGRGAFYFLFSNLLLAVSSGMMAWGPQGSSSAEVTGWLLMAMSHLLLHRSFTEQVGRGRALWNVQLTLAGVAVCLMAGMLPFEGLKPAVAPLLMIVWAAQYMVIAVLLLMQPRRTFRGAGWLAGGVLLLYAACHVWWFLTMVGRRPVDARQREEMALITMLLVHGAITFTFHLLMTIRLRRDLRMEADLDELTGLLNRRAFRVAAARVLAGRREMRSPVSVMMLDLDGMKAINDRYGHSAGDAMLRAVGEVLPEILREQDTVARLGGDEFCILLPETGRDETERIAERCRERLMHLTVNYNGEVLRVSGSFGVACTADGSVGWKELQERSDEALYEAKRTGKNRIVIADMSPASSVLWFRVRQDRGGLRANGRLHLMPKANGRQS